MKTRSANPAERRLVLAGLCVLTCLGLTVGLWAFLPFVQREHCRLEPWKIALVWVGDATALLWFVHYLVVHLLLRRPLQDRPPALVGSWWVALVSLGFGMGCDLAITLALMAEEKARYQTAMVTDGQVTAVRVKRLGTTLTRYDLTCRFVDRAGEAHTAWYTLRDSAKTGFPSGTPPALVQALRTGRTPFPLAVAYDPEWPGRSWIRGTGWDRDDGLHYFSLLPLLYQTFSLPAFVLLLRASVQRTGFYPWWYDLHKVFPALIEAAVLLLFGTIEILIGNMP